MELKYRIRVAIIKRLSEFFIPASIETLLDSPEIINEFGHLPLSNDDKIFAKQQIYELENFGLIKSVIGYEDVYTLPADVKNKIQQQKSSRILPDNEFLWGIDAYLSKK